MLKIFFNLPCVGKGCRRGVGKGRGARKVQVELSSFYFGNLEVAVTVNPQRAVLIINIIAKYLIVL